jgi:hypothetical protein
MYWQLVCGRGLCRAFRMGPARLCPRTCPHDVVRIRAGQVGGKGHVEGQIDLRARGDDRRGARGRRGPLDGSCDGHVVVAPGEREAGRGCHLLPAVPCLAREVGYLVHGGVEEDALGDDGRRWVRGTSESSSSSSSSSSSTRGKRSVVACDWLMVPQRLSPSPTLRHSLEHTTQQETKKQEYQKAGYQRTPQSPIQGGLCQTSLHGVLQRVQHSAS